MPNPMVRSLYKSADMEEDLSISLEPISSEWPTLLGGSKLALDLLVWSVLGPWKSFWTPVSPFRDELQPSETLKISPDTQFGPKLWRGLLPCQLICTVTSSLDWAWKSTPKWPLIYHNPPIGSKDMERSSSMSADLYSDLTIGLGMKNYPKMTPHMPQSTHRFQSYGKVFFQVSWFVQWPHNWIGHEKLPQNDPSYVTICPLVQKLWTD